MLLHVAQSLWKRIPIYQNEMEPSWSCGWLRQFKKKHGIHVVSLHEEAAQVVPTTLEAEMRAVRSATFLYAAEEVYNMDETSLYWKLSPDWGLATEQLSGKF